MTIESTTSVRARQLIAASTRLTHDPFEDVAWTRPVDDSAYHTPPELLALFGTDVWEWMTEPERITYSRHETAATYAAGIWFENALMQIVLRHLLTIDVTDSQHRYLLIEVADECRHSAMFGEYIRRAGTPSYAPQRPLPVDDSDAGRTLSYLLILAIEELLDHVNRAAMRDERIHSTVREISRIHVLEEARHVAFAKTFLAETWPTLSADDQQTVQEAAPVLIAEIVSISLNADVFEQLGIDDGHRIALANPAYRATVARGLGKLTNFLHELGVLHATDRRWNQLGLVA